MHPLLKGVPIFAGLDEEALSTLLNRASQLTIAAGQVVVREGETGNRFFLIGSGSVIVCKRFETSEQITLAKLGAGEFFGEMCILETLPRAATVIAVPETQLFSIPSIAFYHLYQSFPAQYSIMILNIARDLSRRLRRLDESFAAKH